MIGTVVFILVFLVLGLSVVGVAMRSGRGPAGSRRESRAVARARNIGIGLVILVVGLGAPALVLAVNHDNHAKHGPGGVDLTSAQANGRTLFAKSCSTCHTLSASNAVGRVGPNLDDLLAGVQNRKAFVLDAIKNGRSRGSGQMPAGLLVGTDASNVADYLSAVAGR
ncbi:MAG: cytochrome [Baekduia sp.]|nr:c-type cytochrome [Conexibacter sp.]MDX6715580.1 cytochrome [Baekduia sp.]MDX6732521.1 cytochrome [Baekduia sp.]